MKLKEYLNLPSDPQLLEQSLQEQFSGLVPGGILKWQGIPQTDLEGFLVEGESACRPLAPETATRIMDSPPFWSLLWPAGYVLCRTLRSRPDLMRGRDCIDLGSGSGMVSVALAKAGAHVRAVDSDLAALEVTKLHSARAGVYFALSSDWRNEPTQTLFLADFLYDEDNLKCLSGFATHCQEIVVVDSRLKKLELEGFSYLGRREGLAVPDLDPHREFASLGIWYAGPRGPAWKSAFESETTSRR